MAKNGSLMNWVDSLVGERKLEAKVDEALHEFRLADDLVRLREARGLSQRALAQRLGISQPAVAKIESGRATNLQLRTLLRIVTVLGGELVLSVRARGRQSRAESLPVKGVMGAAQPPYRPRRRRAGAPTSGPRSSREPSGIEN
jgi:transcriptional regulator with XRE-family HTH domain